MSGAYFIANYEPFPSIESIQDLIDNKGRWSMFSGVGIRYNKGSELDRRIKMLETTGTRPLSWYAKQAPDKLWDEEDETTNDINKE